MKTTPIYLLLLLLLAACSTTRRIPDGEQLYTGLKHFNVIPPEGEKVPSGVVSAVKEVGNVKPNNPMPFMSPYVRTPFPIGLWVYNNWNDSAKGLKGWLYRKLVREPVLISAVRPQARVEVMKRLMDNNGYFNSSVTYDLLTDKKNPKKARIDYTVHTGEPYLIDSLLLIGDESCNVSCAIDSLAPLDPYLHTGERFSTDSLSVARTRITNKLRNRGYYYFRPEYIEFLADSTIHPGSIALKLSLADGIPPQALRKWYTGDVNVLVLRRSTRNPGTPDTIPYDKGEMVVMRPARLRKGLIPSCITFRKDRAFSVRNMDRTQTRLSRLGIFSAIDMQAYPADTTADCNRLNVDIQCRFDRPMEASAEVNVTSKSNSYLGPGITLGLTNRNLFGGGEQLSVKLTGSYE